MKRLLTIPQKNVFKTMDAMIDFFIKHKGHKPPRLGLDANAYKIFIDFQREQQAGKRFVISEEALSQYRDVQVYRVLNGNDR